MSSSSDARSVRIAIERPSKRQRKPNIVTNVSSEFGDIGYAAAVEEEDCEEESDTSTVREALKGSHADEWQQSIRVIAIRILQFYTFVFCSVKNTKV